MSDLLLHVETVADMTRDSALAVARAFDADPEVRPRRVGGDALPPAVDAVHARWCQG